jgi:hypothetical protein
VTPQALLARLRSKRSTLAATPDIPTLAQRRKELQAEIDELTQALARLH